MQGRRPEETLVPKHVQSREEMCISEAEAIYREFAVSSQPLSPSKSQLHMKTRQIANLAKISFTGR